MAKKKANKVKSKAKQKVSFAADFIRRLLLMFSALIIVGIGGLYLYDRLTHPVDNRSEAVALARSATDRSTAKDTPSRADRLGSKAAERTIAGGARKAGAQATETRPASKDKNASRTASTERKPVKNQVAPKVSDLLPLPKGVEIPLLTQKRTEQVIEHEGYTVSYNSDYRIANWVAYVLTEKEARSDKAERQNKFVVDPLVKGASATNEDYTRTGYDRGHLAPAGDMKWSLKAMRESFYLSNICPQKPGLNRGIWKELEEQIRLWARENGAVLIATGPLIPDDDLPRLGKNRIGVPRCFYKVLCMVVGDRLEGVGFVFENRDYGSTSLRELMMPIDKVEQMVGIDFFPQLPDEVERPMEATFHADIWSF